MGTQSKQPTYASGPLTYRGVPSHADTDFMERVEANPRAFNHDDRRKAKAIRRRFNKRVPNPILLALSPFKGIWP